MEKVLEYLYKGEAELDMEALEKFLEVAGELKIVGLETGKDIGDTANLKVKTMNNAIEEPIDIESGGITVDHSIPDMDQFLALINEQYQTEAIPDDYEPGELFEKVNLDKDDLKAGEKISLKSLLDEKVQIREETKNTVFNGVSLQKVNRQTKRRKVYPCEKCEFRAPKMDMLKKHNKVAHKEHIPCKECTFIASCKAELQIHMVSKHNEFPCDECLQRFRSATELNFHTKDCKK